MDPKQIWDNRRKKKNKKIVNIKDRSIEITQSQELFVSRDEKVWKKKKMNRDSETYAVKVNVPTYI